MSWILCTISESEQEAPDFSRVPEVKRAKVETAWRDKNNVTSEVLLWDAQIPFFASRPYYRVQPVEAQ